MKVRFLLDENLPPRLTVAIKRFNSAIDVRRVGDPDTPPLGTLDPEVLRYLEPPLEGMLWVHGIGGLGERR